MKRSLFFVVAAAFALVPVSTAVAAPPPGTPGARASYVVQFASPEDAAQGAASVRAAGGTVGFVYEHVFPGFSAEMPAAAAFGLAHNPHVVAIEPDAVVTAQTTQANPPSWGLDRIDQHPLPLDTGYSYGDTGAGVTAYIVDTGIRATHTDFTGRVGSGFSAISDGRGTTDCAGHGTHVAGTIGGATYGVAKSVTLVPVRVLNCQGSGTTSGVVAGIDWAVGNHPADASAVLNMSLGGGISSTLDAAVQRATDDGITVVVAAGNSTADACNSSPSRAPSALTIGATTITDARASYSNFGTCLDLFAPGSAITSDWYTSDTGTNTISGTSMASPHVAGIAARYLQGHPAASPASVATALVAAATPNVVTDPGAGSANRLAFADSGLASPPAATVPDAPTGVSATAGDASAVVSWTPPANNGGSSISTYTVTSSPGSFTCTAAASPCTVSGLTNGQSYSFKVTATNGVGTSLPSGSSDTVTPLAPPPPSAITLVATGHKDKGNKIVDLSWTGASGAVDVYRNGVVVKTAPTGTTYSENLGKGSGTYTYKVCNVGTQTCSDPKTVVF
ncbi:MAG TPA: S8 family serine peptidase [Acidimicrobiia bacterium]|nr:S8 family serine peptidase [Acidimicrobiia bacterium]